MLDWSKANVVEAAVEREIGEYEGRVGEDGGKERQVDCKCLLEMLKIIVLQI